LDLHRNRISDVGAKALAGVIKGAKNLQLLILTANRLTDEGVLALAHAAEGRWIIFQPCIFFYLSSTYDMASPLIESEAHVDPI
jgi:hypothetical protein